MSPSHIIILGAGPCGLSTAIALSKTSTAEHPVRITLVEVREKLQTIGGTLNMTPLAMRYLDHLAVGDNLRKDGIDLNDGLDCVSLRTGNRIGNIWGSIGAIRTIRHKVVENLLRKIIEDHADTINVKWGQKVGEIVASEDEITLRFDNGTALRGDILLGCDGLHSLVRRLWIDPQRKETFTGRVLVMGFEESGKTPSMRLSNGEAALRDTAVITSQKGMLLASRYEPTRQKTYFAHTMYMKEPEGDARDGWKILGEDQDAVRREVVDCFNSGQVSGVQETVSKCQNWHLYPVYMLPSEGHWYRGRALLLGDAAHAVSSCAPFSCRASTSTYSIHADAAPGRKYRSRDRRWCSFCTRIRTPRVPHN